MFEAFHEKKSMKGNTLSSEEIVFFFFFKSYIVPRGWNIIQYIMGSVLT